MELNFRLDVGGEKLIIAVAQDYQTNEVLLVAFMNKEAVKQTLKTKKAHYYSTLLHLILLLQEKVLEMYRKLSKSTLTVMQMQ